MDLIADIGATNSRCALLDESGQTVRVSQYENRAFEALEPLLRGFIGDDPVERAALAVAGPVTGDDVAMLNIDWRFNRGRLAEALRVGELAIVNDFEALALALPRLGPDDGNRIGNGEPVAGEPLAVVGPGSGLGVASAVAHQGVYRPVAGEGGHVTLPAQTEIEAIVIRDHADPDGHCSAERLLSGPGLTKIHGSLARHAGQAASPVTPAEVTERALAGDPLAQQTCSIFFALLGTVAGNLALTIGARGGVFIGGGIVPRVITLFGQSDFRDRFIGKGRYRRYLDAIPTTVITVELPALIGLRALLEAGPDRAARAAR